MIRKIIYLLENFVHPVISVGLMPLFQFAYIYFQELFQLPLRIFIEERSIKGLVINFIGDEFSTKNLKVSFSWIGGEPDIPGKRFKFYYVLRISIVTVFKS